MSSEAADETLSIIDAEVLQLRHRISDLLFQRNSRSLISRLPIEVITTIFLYARDSRASWDQSKSVTTMKFSWVCQHWRYISLGCPTLWTEIDFLHSGGVSEFLSRSQQSPLSLTHIDDNLLGDVMSQSHRIQALDFFRASSDRSPRLDLQNLWTKDTPCLRSLSLNGTQFPLHLLTHPPPLQRLKLQNCTFQWNLPLSSTLTVLSIIKPSTTISLGCFLSKLAGLPALIRLKFDSILGNTPPPSGDLAHANLSKLQELKASEKTLAQLKTLVDHLSVSNNTLVYVMISESNGEAEHSDFIKSVHKCRSHTSPITFLHLMEDPTSSMSILDFSEQPPGSDKGLIPTTIRFAGFIDTAPVVTREVINYLDLRSLQELEILQTPPWGHNHAIGFDGWPQIFGNLPNLRSLDVDEYAAYHLVQFFRDEAKEIKDSLAGRESEGVVPLPIELSFRMLREVTLTFPKPPVYEDDGGESFQESRVDKENIIYNLTRRFNEGIRLEYLAFSNWPIDGETLKKLGDVVGTVEEC
ncbi:hypothetical protein BDN72DRAFT_966152 [Pluteus cervinus]|uniref:Uncharacterized protein n=1 Tax=Pluteus cervinus TaxID=181527 RepID=A0ACD3A0A0_9AGAR|nr:hypothetical protein BDN72DRAFT_966152 [Pluteus cervinus]